MNRTKVVELERLEDRLCLSGGTAVVATQPPPPTTPTPQPTDSANGLVQLALDKFDLDVFAVVATINPAAAPEAIQLSWEVYNQMLANPWLNTDVGQHLMSKIDQAFGADPNI